MYAHLREFRESLGMTQTEFGKSIGVAKSTYSNYETGLRKPGSDFWIAVAEKYGVTIDYLMGFSDDPHTTSTDVKKAAPLTQETYQLARDIDRLDRWGKALIRVVVDSELARVGATQTEREESPDLYPLGKVIPLRNSYQAASAGTGVYLGPEEFETIYVQDNDLTRRASFSVPVCGDSMEPLYHDGDILLVERVERINDGEIGIFTLDGSGYVKELGDGELLSLNPDYDPIPMQADIRCNGRVIGVLDPEWIAEE